MHKQPHKHLSDHHHDFPQGPMMGMKPLKHNPTFRYSNSDTKPKILTAPQSLSERTNLRLVTPPPLLSFHLDRDVII